MLEDNYIGPIRWHLVIPILIVWLGTIALVAEATRY
jgi:hypothetical protein